MRIYIDNQEGMNKINISSIQNAKEIVINNVIFIPEGKFYGLDKLTKVTIGNVNIIESGAFMNCKNLEFIEITNKPKEIRDFAFHNTKVGFIPEIYKNTKFGIYNNIRQNITLENISWEDLDKLAKLNKYQEYFKIGDEKNIIVCNDSYIVQIIGFNHDYRSDGRGKTAITFNFKNCIGNYYLNSEKNNKKGWKNSKMRKFLNNEIYNSLPFDLKTVIKEVDKISDNGNLCDSDLITTEDKLFLPSFEEVGFSWNNNMHYKIGQGDEYEYLSNYANRNKKYNLDNSEATWWLRSTYTNSDKFFFCIDSQGYYHFASANKLYGISPCFCI